MMKESRLYDTVQWRKLRLAHLAYEPLCRMCERMGRVTAGNTVDHIKPHKGDIELFFDADNLQTLCTPCHSALKQMEEIHGYSQAVDINGVPFDPKHPWNQTR